MPTMFLISREPRDGFRQDVRRRSAGDVVHEQRQIDARRNRLVVPEDAVLRGFVVVGRQQQRAVGAHLARSGGQPNRLGGRVRAGARDHRDALSRLLDRELDHIVVFGVSKRGGFSGRAARNQPVDPALNLPLDQIAQRGRVHLAVAKRRYESGQCTIEHRSKPPAFSFDRDHLVGAQFDRAAENLDGIAGHENVIRIGSIGAPFDFKIAAAQLDRRGPLAMIGQNRRDQRRARPGAARPGLARAALPYSHLKMVRATWPE